MLQEFAIHGRFQYNTGKNQSNGVMPMSHRGRDDHGEHWGVAITLLDKPRALPDIEEQFLAIGRRFGFFRFDATHSREGKTMAQWLAERLPEMIHAGWVVHEGDRYSLTDTGRTEAQKACREAETAGAVLKKLQSPLLVSKVTLWVHFFLALLKLPAALLSGSVGLLSDAMDTLADAVSSLLVYFGIRHHKERLANTALVALMLITGDTPCMNRSSGSSAPRFPLWILLPLSRCWYPPPCAACSGSTSAMWASKTRPPHSSPNR